MSVRTGAIGLIGAAAILSTVVAGCGANENTPDGASTSAVASPAAAEHREGGTASDYAEITDVIQRSVTAMSSLDGKSFDAMQCREYRPSPGSPDSFSDLLGDTQRGVKLVGVERITVSGDSAKATYALQYRHLPDASSVDGSLIREGGNWLLC